MAFTSLLNPTSKAAEVLARYKISMSEIDVKANGLSSVIQVFHDKQLSLNDAVQIFGQRAGPMMYAVIQQGSGVLDENTNKLKDNVGYMQKMTDEMNGGFGGAVRRFKADLENLKISAGGDIAFVITPLVKGASLLMKGYSVLPSTFRKVSVALIGLGVASLAAVSALGTFGLIVGGLESLGITAAMVSAAFAEIVIPAAVIGASLIYVEEKTGMVSKGFTLLSDMATIVWHGLSEDVSEAISDISGYLNSLKEYVLDAALILDDLGIIDFSAWESSFNSAKGYVSNFVSETHNMAEGIKQESENVQTNMFDASQATQDAYSIADEANKSWTDSAFEWSSGVTDANEEVQGALQETQSAYEKAVSSLQEDVTTQQTAGIKVMSKGVDVDDLRRGIKTLNDELIILNDSNELVKVSADGMVTSLKGANDLHFETTRGGLDILASTQDTLKSKTEEANRIIQNTNNDVIVLGDSVNTLNGSNLSDITSQLTGIKQNTDDSNYSVSLLNGQLRISDSVTLGNVAGQIQGVESSIDSTTGKTGSLNSTLEATNLIPMSQLLDNQQAVNSQINTNNTDASNFNSTLNETNLTPFGTVNGNLSVVGANLDTTKIKANDTNNSLSTMGNFSFSTTQSGLDGIWSKLGNIYDRAKNAVSKLSEIGTSSGNASSSVSSSASSRNSSISESSTSNKNNNGWSVNVGTINNYGNAVNQNKTKLSVLRGG
jgi:hypothetical protein